MEGTRGQKLLLVSVRRREIGICFMNFDLRREVHRYLSNVAIVGHVAEAWLQDGAQESG